MSELAKNCSQKQALKAHNFNKLSVNDIPDSFSKLKKAKSTGAHYIVVNDASAVVNGDLGVVEIAGDCILVDVTGIGSSYTDIKSKKKVKRVYVQLSEFDEKSDENNQTPEHENKVDSSDATRSDAKKPKTKKSKAKKQKNKAKKKSKVEAKAEADISEESLIPGFDAIEPVPFSKDNPFGKESAMNDKSKFFNMVLGSAVISLTTTLSVLSFML